MAFDDLKAELALLINQMDNPPEDAHELYLQDLREAERVQGARHAAARRPGPRGEGARGLFQAQRPKRRGKKS